MDVVEIVISGGSINESAVVIEDPSELGFVICDLRAWNFLVQFW